MIEVGKKFFISIKDDSDIANSLRNAQEDVNWNHLHGEVMYVHLHGFLFKLVQFPKIATMNITWDALQWIYPAEKVNVINTF